MARHRGTETHGTTILAVVRDDRVALGGDGQVTVGPIVMKSDARKVRKLREGKVLVGFAGATADALALVQRFEEALSKRQGQVKRAAIDLATEWRTDKVLRRLESQLIVADEKNCLLLSGMGDVIEPEDGVLGIGSGGPYAVAAARALLAHTKLGAREIVEEALRIAGQMCIYTNDRIEVHELP